MSHVGNQTRVRFQWSPDQRFLVGCHSVVRVIFVCVSVSRFFVFVKCFCLCFTLSGLCRAPFHVQVMAAEELAAFARSRGGTRQQADRFEQQHWQSQRLPTKLAEVLLDLWRWGRLPATLVQRIAAAAEQDLRNAYDKKLDEWSTLARLGAYGQHTGNIRRDLMAKLPRPFAEVLRLHLFVCVFCLRHASVRFAM